MLILLAPRDGFEPPTNGLTVRRSTTELPGNAKEARIVGKARSYVKESRACRSLPKFLYFIVQSQLLENAKPVDHLPVSRDPLLFKIVDRRTRHLDPPSGGRKPRHIARMGSRPKPGRNHGIAIRKR